MNEWIKYGKTWEDFEDANLPDAGILIDVEDEQYLIGDINKLSGVCDDCTAFSPDAIVTRYKRVCEVSPNTLPDSGGA